MTRQHFCFDIGHAKIWSNDSLDDWLGFMADLESAGFILHCHLHANSGFADEHLSLAEANAREISAPDVDYNPYGYPAAYLQVEQHFPAATKIFEVKAEQAIANYEAVLEHCNLITYQFLPPAKSRQGKVILQAPLQST